METACRNMQGEAESWVWCVWEKVREKCGEWLGKVNDHGHGCHDTRLLNVLPLLSFKL